MMYITLALAPAKAFFILKSTSRGLELLAQHPESQQDGQAREAFPLA